MRGSSGGHDKARQHWARAIAEADRFNKVYEKGLAHYDIGRFDPKGAGHLQRACEIFERLGFEYHERRTRALMQPNASLLPLVTEPVDAVVADDLRGISADGA